MSATAVTAEAGSPNTASTPSPSVFTTRPPWWPSAAAIHSVNPVTAVVARVLPCASNSAVVPTMSENTTVCRTVLMGGAQWPAAWPQ